MSYIDLSIYIMTCTICFIDQSAVQDKSAVQRKIYYHVIIMHCFTSLLLHQEFLRVGKLVTVASYFFQLQRALNALSPRWVDVKVTLRIVYSHTRAQSHFKVLLVHNLLLQFYNILCLKLLSSALLDVHTHRKVQSYQITFRVSSDIDLLVKCARR